MASSSMSCGVSTSARRLRPPRALDLNAGVVAPVLQVDHSALETPALGASTRSSTDDGAAKTAKRKRKVPRSKRGARGSTDASTLAVLEKEQAELLEVEVDAVTVDDAVASASAGNPSSIAAASTGAYQAAGGHVPVPDAAETLVIRKKWRRQAQEGSELPGLRCWSAEERVGVHGDSLWLSPPLRRSVSTFDIQAKRPSLERRQLSAAATDAVTVAAHELVLPTVKSKDHPDLNVIAPATVRRVLAGEYNDRLASFELIDCRFPYEHRGGSLRGARSLVDPASVEAAFMARPSPDCSRIALIFFCEFSANRAPKMARHMRNLDRWIHADRYPELFYPELYLIDGGYKNCFEVFKGELCDPPAYVRMRDDKFADACRAEFSAWRRQWKAHKRINCAREFQFQSQFQSERPSESPAASSSAAKTKGRARPVQSLVEQL